MSLIRHVEITGGVLFVVVFPGRSLKDTWPLPNFRDPINVGCRWRQSISVNNPGPGGTADGAGWKKKMYINTKPTRYKYLTPGVPRRAAPFIKFAFANYKEYNIAVIYSYSSFIKVCSGPGAENKEQTSKSPGEIFFWTLHLEILARSTTYANAFKKSLEFTAPFRNTLLSELGGKIFSMFPIM